MRQSENIIPSRLNLIDLGEIDFIAAHEHQKRVRDGIIQNNLPDTLIFCQHPHTLTSGRLGKSNNLLVKKAHLKRKGVSFYVIDRGGDITYHGPGQLVMYPIFNLGRHRKDLKWFITNLEQVIIDFLKEFGIISKRNPGYTGVWVDDKKIASIGIGVRHWVTYHGIAINLNTDLRYFSMIRPCGLNAEMTSFEDVANYELDFKIAKKIFLEKFVKIFKMGGVDL